MSQPSGSNDGHSETPSACPSGKRRRRLFPSPLPHFTRHWVLFSLGVIFTLALASRVAFVIVRPSGSGPGAGLVAEVAVGVTNRATLAGAVLLGTLGYALAVVRERLAIIHRWEEGDARCSEKEVFRAWETTGSGPGRYYWYAHVVCEFVYDGEPYQVEPSLHAGRWESYAIGSKFLARKIARDGSCQLRVNPANPSLTVLMPFEDKGWHFRAFAPLIVVAIFLLTYYFVAL